MGCKRLGTWWTGLLMFKGLVLVVLKLLMHWHFLPPLLCQGSEVEQAGWCVCVCACMVERDIVFFVHTKWEVCLRFKYWFHKGSLRRVWLKNCRVATCWSRFFWWPSADTEEVCGSEVKWQGLESALPSGKMMDCSPWVVCGLLG